MSEIFVVLFFSRWIHVLEGKKKREKKIKTEIYLNRIIKSLLDMRDQDLEKLCEVKRYSEGTCRNS